MKQNLSSREALQRLTEGNARYMTALTNPGNISPAIRRHTVQNGQSPYAVILACSDSREIPEAIFCAGIGELFVIRVAGNVVDAHQLGSIEYAADHLGCRLVVVLGHDHCGAVGAALDHASGGHIGSITDRIAAAIKDETDAFKASCLNVENSVRCIREQAQITGDVSVIGAMYHLDDGRVEFLDI